ncbi:hypothetical protein [Clostridium saccharobutylicum]|uniref:Uncharacterized protein n=1 Tax=Clostridium saccharobutylicum DSM 13864 TaxID=1345695 RepID=U5MXY5_CLOSA|nr:hypothetical protein [Clostridium saccharobutylicum]AGX44347.1 hypothetical protein CLSA_c33840 [Clostridium saccharobutylicum DSM 13864]AQR91640.1 hypothetical protein CLOSC_33660 [Clostridium saccharobutylicum]AQS01545.1 hypothetical protein CSACC_33740 [Clostridium saccharobutylicum]AQS11152.1 hypothetical protein CLOBY_33060 [Clostridium saccharobutylicum]AQS15528.1 hypothetical protein CLOSACC_33740 [Clostridium saccharobutylicum]
MGSTFIREYKYSILMIIVGIILILIGIDRSGNYLVLSKAVAISLHYIGIG